MGYTALEEYSTKPPKRKSKQEASASSKRKYSKKALPSTSKISSNSQETGTLTKNASSPTTETAIVNSEYEKTVYAPETSEKNNLDKPYCSSVSPAMGPYPRNLNSKVSNQLNGLDVSLNDNDIEYLEIKAAEDEYKKLKEQNDKLKHSIICAKSNLKKYENDYKFQMEERNLTKEDILSFCHEILHLPHIEPSDKLENVLQKSDSAPEDVFLVQDEIKKLLNDLYDSETGKRESLEEALNNFPSKRKVELNDQILRDLEAEEEILMREIVALEKRYAISAVMQSSTSALLTDASNDTSSPHPDLLSHRKFSTPKKEKFKISTQKNIMGEGLANSIPVNPEDNIGTSILDNDTFNISIIDIPEDAAQASALDEKSIAFSYLGLSEDDGELFLDDVSIVSPIADVPENATGVTADVVRDVLNQHDKKGDDGLPEILDKEVYRAQLYLQRSDLMAKSRSRLEKLLGL